MALTCALPATADDTAPGTVQDTPAQGVPRLPMMSKTKAPGTPEALMYGFNEFSFVAGYDFGVAAVTGAVRYSPNFFANSGEAWYKWGQIAVPLPFLKVNENVSFKAFGTLGNQYVQTFTNFGIPSNNYWDWQAGLIVSFYGFDFTAAYTGTNLSVQDCLGTQNCASRVIVGLRG